MSILRARTGGDVIGDRQLDRSCYFQAQALFVGADNEMLSAREEIFGPCASVIKVDDFDEALAVANDTPFCLSTGICITSLKYTTEFRRKSAGGW
ncbi:aldehyde dehydrogenase family protein [Thalassospira sp. HF15]|uniref:aldehyde dehydrogenase family protein n=1 Tax=Thalassospira sp. HF15 TaxID=2722755 RepID=UPI001C3771C6|nr:aldehyde dehydrogenase family protein [Thalassospira sp. HF15]